MKVFNSTSKATGKIKNAVVTTGSFDGVHIGHKVIINRLNQLARDQDGESVLITFHPHPRKVLYPEQKDLKLINSQEEKIELLSKAGLDNLIVIPFSVEFSKTSSHDFVTEILIGELGARIVVIGHNHHFGHNRKGDYSYLHALSKEYGFGLEEIPLKDIENETVSSTKIRKALLEGNIQRANAYLDHQYIISSGLINGQGLPGMNELKTIRSLITEEEKLIPPPGIYATNLLQGGKWLKSMSFVLENEHGKRFVESALVYDPFDEKINHGTLYFYKKITDGNPLNNGEVSRTKVNEAREMIEELIY